MDLTRKKKSVIAFVDGDRGGTIILNELQQVAKLDYIARAPEGFEVEELTRKQLIKALQNKRSIKGEVIEQVEPSVPVPNPKDDALTKMLNKVKIKNGKNLMDTVHSIQAGQAIGFDKEGQKLFEIPVSELYEKIENHADLQGLVINGILSERLLVLLMKMNVSFVSCRNKEEDLMIPNKLSVYFF